MQTYDIDILDYIRTGHDRAITRAELSDLTGIDDRTIRDMIHYARRDIPILNMQDGRGYFIPDMNILEERMMLMKYIRQEESRLKSIGWALKTARRAMELHYAKSATKKRIESVDQNARMDKDSQRSAGQ